MSLKVLTYVVVGASFALYVGIAIWSRAQNTGDFYIAGKGVSPLANGMATAADWMSAASFISMAGLIAFLGYDGSVYLMGWTGGYVLLALFLAPYLRKFGKFTVPEFIAERYYSKTARIVAVICLIFVSFTYVAGQMRGVGIVFSRFLEVDVTVGLIIGMGIVFVYAVLGGMKGITYTQVAQYCVLIFAYTVPAVFIAIQVTGSAIPQLAFGGNVSGAEIGLLDKLDDIVTSLGFSRYTSGTKSTIDVFCITLALMVGTAGLPHVIVRFFTVPKVRDARLSAGYALLFIAVLYTTAPAVGAMARYNLVNTVQPGAVGALDGNLAYGDRPAWMNTWQKTGLVSFVDKNGDGRIQYYNDANPAFAETAAAYGWEGNELKVDRDIMVLANPEIAGLPDWVIALVAAGGIAAALSTAAGLLLVISAAISHDIIKGIFVPDISEQKELLAGRIAAALAIMVAGYLGFDPPGWVAPAKRARSQAC
jgi:cation/acetate symporter